MALLKRGLRNVWLRGVRALDPSAPRVVGRAFTMRFVPGREDLATPESLASSKSTRFAIEEISAGSVAVVSSCGIVDAGVFGDILCARMVQRGVGGLITDGAVRDVEGVRRTGLPVWCSGVSPPPLAAQLTFVDWQQPIGLRRSRDLSRRHSDRRPGRSRRHPEGDGARHAGEQPGNRGAGGMDSEQVNAGRKLPGLYPPNEDAKAEFLSWRSRR